MSGLDIVDGTPVLDVKPYVPYADSIPDAIGGFANAAPDSAAIQVSFTPEAESQCLAIERQGIAGFRELARKLVAENPRPAYQDIEGRIYGIFIHGYEVIWQAGDDGTATITAVKICQ